MPQATSRDSAKVTTAPNIAMLAADRRGGPLVAASTKARSGPSTTTGPAPGRGAARTNAKAPPAPPLRAPRGACGPPRARAPPERRRPKPPAPSAAERSVGEQQPPPRHGAEWPPIKCRVGEVPAKCRVCEPRQQQGSSHRSRLSPGPAGRLLEKSMIGSHRQQGAAGIADEDHERGKTR